MNVPTTTLNTNGDIHVPEDVQSALGLAAGTRFAVTLAEGHIVLKPLLASSLEELQNLFASDRDLVAELQQERRQEKW